MRRGLRFQECRSSTVISESVGGQRAAGPGVDIFVERVRELEQVVVRRLRECDRLFEQVRGLVPLVGGIHDYSCQNGLFASSRAST